MGVKAFELVPAIEKFRFMSEKARTEIECIESCGKNLYIGTNDCFIVHYKLEEQTIANGRVSYTSEKIGHKYLALKKPIVKLKSVSAINRILCLCDNTLGLINMMDLEPIAGGSKLKGVHSFCLNEHPVKGDPFSVEIGVALRKKQIQVYIVTEDRMQLYREVPTPELPMNISMDGLHVCLAGTSQYYIMNYSNGRNIDLFPYNSETTIPSINRITKDEFLLSGPNALGMFATSHGISQRPPLQWSDNLLAVAYLHPYILALNDEFCTVHSILDQQQKQSIAFSGGRCLGEFDGRLFVASANAVYSLVPVPLEKQVNALLEDNRVTEALDLAKNARKTGLSKESFTKMYQRIEQQAGFIEFSALHFDQARELFQHGKLDIRELISVYPMLLPDSSTFSRSQPPLHGIADVGQLAAGDTHRIHQYKDFLVQYLEEIRDAPAEAAHEAIEARMEVDTALLKLYAEMSSPELESVIVSFTGDAEDCESYLAKYGHHHAMALLYRFKARHEQALAIWSRLLAGEAHDDAFPGIKFVVEVLANIQETDLVWKYVDQVMEYDEVEAVRVFTERPVEDTSCEKLNEESVVEYLSRFPKAIVLYLEYLVFTQKSTSEKIHSHLAVLYLDQVLALLQAEPKDWAALDAARTSFQTLLQDSCLYRTQMLLGKIKQTELHKETAILYGKLEEHDKAMHILVHKLHDYTAAERYCEINSCKKDSAYKRRLYQSLLSVYLDVGEDGTSGSEAMVEPALSLLNNTQADFDVVKVLGVLPDNWSIGLISAFLTHSVRSSMVKAKTTHLQRMLDRSVSIQAKAETLNLRRQHMTLEEDKQCAVCNAALSSDSVVRYPNGIVTHTACARNMNVCPVTGKIFSTQKQDSDGPLQP